MWFIVENIVSSVRCWIFIFILFVVLFTAEENREQFRFVHICSDLVKNNHGHLNFHRILNLLYTCSEFVIGRQL